MTGLTKATYRTMIQQYFDDPNAARWSAANLDQLTSLVYDELWVSILDTNAYWNMQYDTINLPLHPPGFIDLRTTGDGGDLSQRFYRLQQCIADGRHYFAKDPRDYLMVASVAGDPTTIQASTGIEQRFSYQFLGSQLWLHPLGNVTTFVELRYNFRPPIYTTLADGAIVNFPDGCEHAIILATAVHAMAKGNAEDTMQLRQFAAEAKQNLLDNVRRRYHGPTVAFLPENQWEWGGV